MGGGIINVIYKICAPSPPPPKHSFLFVAEERRKEDEDEDEEENEEENERHDRARETPGALGSGQVRSGQVRCCRQPGLRGSTGTVQ